MGAVTSHCVADRPEEGGCTFDPHDATTGEHGYSAGGCAQLECELGEQFLVASNIRDDALNDKECADVVLVQAVMRGDLEDVKKAMANDATVDTFAEIALFRGVRDQQRIKYVTPLMRACDCGREEVISYLLRHRADPVRQDSRKFNALCYALGAGELALARVLLEESPHTAKMQQVAAWRQAEEIMDQCEEAAGHEVAAELRKDFPFLLLTPQEIMEQFNWRFCGDPTVPVDDPAYQLRIYAVNTKQFTAATASVKATEKRLNATSLQLRVLNASAFTFWKAEEYHQQYFKKSGEACGQLKDGSRRGPNRVVRHV